VFFGNHDSEKILDELAGYQNVAPHSPGDDLRCHKKERCDEIRVKVRHQDYHQNQEAVGLDAIHERPRGWPPEPHQYLRPIEWRNRYKVKYQQPQVQRENFEKHPIKKIDRWVGHLSQQIRVPKGKIDE